jgi:hypothetical protein
MHAIQGTAKADALALLKMALSRPLGTTGDGCTRLREAMKHLLSENLAEILDEGKTSLGQTCIDALRTDLPKGWEFVQSVAVGRLLGGSRSKISMVVHSALGGCPQFRYFIALKEAANGPAAGDVLNALCELSSQDIDGRWLRMLSDLAAVLAQRVSRDDKGRLEIWIKRLRESNPSALAGASVALANVTHDEVEDLVDKIIGNEPERAMGAVAAYVATAPTSVIDSLASRIEALFSKTNSPAALRALAEIYRVQSSRDSSAIAKLVELARGSGKLGALAASKALVSLSQDTNILSVGSLLPLSGSAYDGVRLNGLLGIKHIVKREGGLTGPQFTGLFSLYGGDTSHLIIHALLELTTECVKRGGNPVPDVTTAVEPLLGRLLHGPAEPGAVKLTIRVLKALAHDRNLASVEFAGFWIKRLMSTVDLSGIRNGESEALATLSIIGRKIEGFLIELAKCCCTWPVQNARAIVLAIRRVDGPNSTLLDLVLEAPGASDEVKMLILAMRRA